MPSSHEVNPGIRLGVIRFWGHIDGRELVAETRKFFESDGWESGFRVLWDARNVDGLDLTPTDVQAETELLATVRPDLGPGRSAVVAELPDVVTSGHLIRALTVRTIKREVKIFEDMNDAVEWLAHDDEPIPPAVHTPRNRRRSRRSRS